MTFLQQLNDYFFLLAFFLAIVLLIGFSTGVRNGGFIRHLPYLFSLFVIAVYGLITPFFFYNTGFFTIIGTDISNYYGAGIAFNLLATVCFVVGYWVNTNRLEKWRTPMLRTLSRPEFNITILFLVFFGISLINLALGGVNLAKVVTGSEVVGLGASGATYYLQNFTDSIITIILLAYLYNVPKKKLLAFIIFSFFLFSLLGFRYRIILTLFGLLFIYLYKHKVTVRQIFGAITLGLVFFYAIMVSTVNRWQLLNRNYTELKFNPAEFDYSIFFSQTRGALADMAIYRHYDTPGRGAEHDHGITMFGYVFIRMIPRAIMPDKDKFYPPPQLATTIQAYDAWWGRFSGEATLNIAAFYIAFGWLGIVFGCFFWGLFLRKFGNGISKDDPLKFVVYIIITLVSFQWITRGYMPQIIDQAIYMLIPVWILQVIAKKNPTKK